MKRIDLIVLLALGLVLFLIYAYTHPYRYPLANMRAVQAQIKAFGTALDMFKDDSGHYPTSTNGLQALVTQPAGATNWHQCMEKIPLDPWGHPYLYAYPGKHNTNSFDLSSAGPDGKFDTVDDIVNWK